MLYLLRNLHVKAVKVIQILYLPAFRSASSAAAITKSARRGSLKAAPVTKSALGTSINIVPTTKSALQGLPSAAFHEICISKFIKYCTYHEICTSRFIKCCTCHEHCMSRFSKCCISHELCAPRRSPSCPKCCTCHESCISNTSDPFHLLRKIDFGIPKYEISFVPAKKIITMCENAHGTTTRVQSLETLAAHTQILRACAIEMHFEDFKRHEYTAARNSENPSVCPYCLGRKYLFSKIYNLYMYI